jgi:hypothetical protein
MNKETWNINWNEMYMSVDSNEKDSEDVQKDSFLDEKLKKFKTYKEKTSHKNNNQFDENEIISEQLLQDIIPPWTIVHLASKARVHDILTSKKRKSLYEIGKLKALKFELSCDQSDYLEDMLAQAVSQGIVEVPCEKQTCIRCEKLKQLFFNKKNFRRI